jgi:hypothetical protein
LQEYIYPAVYLHVNTVLINRFHGEHEINLNNILKIQFLSHKEHTWRRDNGCRCLAQ